MPHRPAWKSLCHVWYIGVLRTDMPRQQRTWTQDDDRILREVYTNGPRGQVMVEAAKRLSRTEASVQARAQVLKLKSRQVRRWTEDEDKILREMYAARTSRHLGLADIVSAIGRSEKQIYAHAQWLGLNEKYTPFSGDEDARIRSMYSAKIRAPQIAIALGRSVHAVRGRMTNIGAHVPRAKLKAQATAVHQQAPERLAWLAGLMDGEGCFGLYASRTNKRWNEGTMYKPQVYLRMVHRPTIDFAHSIIGGIERYEFPPSKQKRCRPTWGISVGSTIRVVELLSAIRPWLVTKAEEADVLIDACKRMIAGENGEALRWHERRLKELKARAYGIQKYTGIDNPPTHSDSLVKTNGQIP